MSESANDDAARHMNGIYKYQRFIYDVTRKYYLLGRDRLLVDLQPEPGAAVLEIGCGTGRNLILAARRYPDSTFYGFDISTEMLTTARSAIARAGLEDRVIVDQGDASNFDLERLFGLKAADRVFISYSLSMIPPWRESIDAALRAVSIGGRLHIVDFGQQSGLPAWFKAALFAWLARFSVTPRSELSSEVKRRAEALGFSYDGQALYRDYAHYAIVSRAK
ncbi:MAG: class I SAM-dependent methyltransferase [Hyphomicrobiaceae bacterium]